MCVTAPFDNPGGNFCALRTDMIQQKHVRSAGGDVPGAAQGPGAGHDEGADRGPVLPLEKNLVSEVMQLGAKVSTEYPLLQRVL